MRAVWACALLSSLVLGCGACGAQSQPAPAEQSADPVEAETAPDDPAPDGVLGAMSPEAEAQLVEQLNADPSFQQAAADFAAESSTHPVTCPPHEEWPEGMACVLGGTFTLGDADGQANEQTPGEVYVDSFFMDLTEVTNEAYEECIQSGTCVRQMPFRRFMRPRQPAVAMSWFDALHHCERLGKRLPTEAEWERGAAGPDNTRFPWGDEEPEGCEMALVKNAEGEGCGREITSPVGSYPAGHWGLFDMAGNVHEWVNDRYSECLTGCDRECGDACFGDNPRGPCGGGLERCPRYGMRSVRGGSWYWPLERSRAQARRGSGAPNRGPHRFGFRCARDLTVPDPTVPGDGENTED
ncbi:MAG: hypothetical protein DRJ42_01860 [Deltaproteobacteria bacterium]|nr:MAG: hypothetical protein DRJ42_01860 [Deltaproteobacteria bacterium]